MSEPVPYLRVVDAETGEVHDGCPNCERYAAELAGLTKEVRAWRTRYYELKRDKDRDAREHKAFPLAKRLFDIWRIACKHEGAVFTTERFELTERRIRQYGEVRCVRAIMGAAHAPYTPKDKNGKPDPQNYYHQVFHHDKFERFERKAPARFTDDYIREKVLADEPAQAD